MNQHRLLASALLSKPKNGGHSLLSQWAWDNQNSVLAVVNPEELPPLDQITPEVLAELVRHNGQLALIAESAGMCLDIDKHGNEVPAHDMPQSLDEIER